MSSTGSDKKERMVLQCHAALPHVQHRCTSSARSDAHRTRGWLTQSYTFVILTILCLLFGWQINGAAADIVRVTQQLGLQGQANYFGYIHSTEMISAKDAPFTTHNNGAFIQWTAVVQAAGPVKNDTPEIRFYLIPLVDNVPDYCNPDILEDPATKPFFSASVFVKEGEQKETITETWKIDKTGQYMMIYSSCALDQALTLEITSIWKNPFGHLSGSLLGNMLFSRALVIIYSVIIPIWIILAIAYRENITHIHKLVAVVACLCLVDAIFAYCDYWFHNEHGRPSAWLVGLATIATTLQQAAWPVLCFTIALGYGISRPTLGIWRHRLIWCAVVYFCAVAIQRAADRHGARVIMALAGSVRFSLTLFMFVATCAAVYDTTLQLRARRQEIKLGLYRKVTILLVITALAFISFEIYSFIAIQFSHRYLQRHWSLWWLHSGGFSQIVYLFDVISVAFIFRPSVDMSRYQYQQFADRAGRDGEFEDLQLDSVEVELGLFDGSDKPNDQIQNVRLGGSQQASSSILDTDNDDPELGTGSQRLSTLPDSSGASTPSGSQRLNSQGVGNYDEPEGYNESVLDELAEELGLEPEDPTRRTRQSIGELEIDADLTEH